MSLYHIDSILEKPVESKDDNYLVRLQADM